MSTTQVSAMVLLCQVLEQAKPQINGAVLFGEQPDEPRGAASELVRERLMVLGIPRSYVTCPDCGAEMARVVRTAGVGHVLLYCDDCAEVQASDKLVDTYTVSLKRVVDRLSASLALPANAGKVIDPEISWRLGVQEHKRGKAQTWYFARHLDNPSVAKHLVDQIRVDHATQSAKILTTTAMPLPDGSPLAGYDVAHLASVARLSQSQFLFFEDRLDAPVLRPVEEAAPTTSLRHLRDKGWAYVDGVKYELEGMQQKILLALIDAHGHRLEGRQIGERCGSSAFPFQPAKYFGRNKEVYKAFVQFTQDDKVYELIFHPEDQPWL